MVHCTYASVAERSNATDCKSVVERLRRFESCPAHNYMHKSDKSNKESNVSVRVGRSKAGLGLFAEERIPKGTFIIEYYGPVMTEDEADDHPNKYLFAITKKRVIDGSPRYNLARYINHSCRPNAESMISKRKYVYIYATRNIAEGEEIAYDYGEEYFDEFIAPHGCRCTKCSKRS